MLFLLLIDIMRNPEVLRGLTDSMLETRLDLFYKQIKGT